MTALLFQKGRSLIILFVILISWLFIWNHLNIEFAGKILSFFFQVEKSSFLFFFLSSFLLLTFSLTLLFLWKLFFREISFLKTHNKMIFFLYGLPLLIFFLSFILSPDVPPEEVFLTQFSFFALSFSQDIFAFGILQSILEKIVCDIWATVLTTTMFFIGHTGFFPPGIFILLYVFGFFLFGFLRYKTKNIYALNIVHLSFNFLRIFF
jgi:membrane protease YdiL (CAAX protease family)